MDRKSPDRTAQERGAFPVFSRLLELPARFRLSWRTMQVIQFNVGVSE